METKRGYFFKYKYITKYSRIFTEGGVVVVGRGVGDGDNGGCGCVVRGGGIWAKS